MVQINWTKRSLEDLKDILDYISKDSVKYARLQVVRIRNRVKLLDSHLYAGKEVQEYKRKDIRELIEGNYRIIYKIVNKERIDILTIHHSSRDLVKRNIK